MSNKAFQPPLRTARLKADVLRSAGSRKPMLYGTCRSALVAESTHHCGANARRKRYRMGEHPSRACGLTPCMT